MARTSGRKGRPWRECQATVRARSDVCCWCGHHGARDVNHDLGLAQSLVLGVANNPDYCSPIHGVTSRCPVCPPKWSIRAGRHMHRACNGEVGARPLAVALAQRAKKLTHTHGDRQW